MIKAACEGVFTFRQVAERLKISKRRVSDRAFIHGNTGRVPVNKTPLETRQKIITKYIIPKKITNGGKKRVQ